MYGIYFNFAAIGSPIENICYLADDYGLTTDKNKAMEFKTEKECRDEIDTMIKDRLDFQKGCHPSTHITAEVLRRVYVPVKI